MTDKLVTLEEAVSKIKSGDTVMVGGFMNAGSPNNVLEALSKTDVKDLTIISNDTAFVGQGLGMLIDSKQVSKLITSHIGTNRETGRQMIAEEIEVNLVPQGTLIEQIRAGGFGLGGFLTPTGLGTEVEKGKEVVTVDGKDFLLELPLRADVALIYADQADKKGNLKYHGSTQNFNNMMATAADLVIVDAVEYLEDTTFEQDTVHVPSVFTDVIIDGGKL